VVTVDDNVDVAELDMLDVAVDVTVVGLFSSVDAVDVALVVTVLKPQSVYTPV
jgi:hypothetical protein